MKKQKSGLRIQESEVGALGKHPDYSLKTPVNLISEFSILTPDS